MFADNFYRRRQDPATRTIIRGGPRPEGVQIYAAFYKFISQLGKDDLDKMRRTALLLLTLSLVVSMAVGVASAKTTITFWTMSLTPNFTEFLEDIVARYEAQNPDVTVIWKDIPHTTLREQFLAAAAAGDVPDVVNFPSAWTIAMAQRGVLHAVDDVISPEDRALYFEGILNSTRWDGKVWALPWYVTPDMLFVNEEIFERAGLSVDNPPATWDETIEYARIIQDKTGIYGFSPNFILDNILTRNAIPLLDDAGQVGFNNDEAIELLAKWVQVYNDGLVPPDVATNIRAGELDGIQRYQAGRLGMLITGPQFVSRIRNEAPDVYGKTVAVPLPVGKAGTARAAVQNIAISKQSKAPEVAADFALFVTNAENQLAFAKLVTIFPSIIEAAQDPFFTAGGDTPDDQARLIAAADLQKIDATPTDLPDSGRMIQILDDAMTNALLGVKTPKQAIEDAAQDWEKILVEHQ